MPSSRLPLQYHQDLHIFAVTDAQVAAVTAAGLLPEVYLDAAAYTLLGESLPRSDAPLIGFLCCREGNMYSVDFNYAKSLAKSGVNLRFLTYENCVEQMQEVDGLMLPGGRFPSPPEIYVEATVDNNSTPADYTRAEAYIACIKAAEQRGLPILGVCAGAQMIAAVHGLKLYRHIHQSVATDIEHKTLKPEAHTVTISPDSELYELLQTAKAVVNSRHIEAVVGTGAASDLQIYAQAPDGVPEAWGNRKKRILCIQWHPEDFAAAGNTAMQNLYDWLARRAAEK